MKTVQSFWKHCREFFFWEMIENLVGFSSISEKYVKNFWKSCLIFRESHENLVLKNCLVFIRKPCLVFVRIFWKTWSIKYEKFHVSLKKVKNFLKILLDFLKTFFFYFQGKKKKNLCQTLEPELLDNTSQLQWMQETP